MPRRVVFSSSAHTHAAHGVNPTNGVRVHVSGVDLIRDEEGRFRVLEDNLRTPSGISYVVENRRARARVFPELFATHRVRPVAEYPARLLLALKAAAPAGSPTTSSSTTLRAAVSADPRAWKGVYAGGGSQSLGVSVEVTRLA